MTHLIDFNFFDSPEQAQKVAPVIWAAFPPKVQRVLMWGLPFEKRAKFFAKTLAAADIICVASIDAKFQGACWLRRTVQGSLCWEIHFAFAEFANSFRIAQVFISTLKETLSNIKSLLAISPLPYRHSRRFAEALGFQELGRVPGACVLCEHNNKVVDGVFYVLKWGK